jgi:hypothetical protein
MNDGGFRYSRRFLDELFDRSDKLKVKFFTLASFTGKASNF